MFEKLHILAVTNTYPTAATPGDSPQIKDLVEALKELERRAGASGQPFDAVLLETTGVADPGPVVR